MLIHWIWLATRQGINDRDKASLLEHFQDPEDLYYAPDSAFDTFPEEARAALTDRDLSGAEKILSDCMEKDIRICTYRDAAYPNRLRNIADPPLVLYYKGKLPELDSLPCIAVVGTRKATAYGVKSARQMAYQIAQCGGLVVTGLAEGIDGAGATGALMGGGTVVGVLGNGADVVYPAFHRGIYEDTQRNGCLLTEFPPGTPPYKWNFPKRNRIISGLCCGVLVVEAPQKSGSLITARDAAEQGRDVFVVPGNVDVETFVGSNALLRQGATPVTCGWDVISEYTHLYPGKVRQPGVLKMQPTESQPMVAQKPLTLKKEPSAARKKDKKDIDKAASPSYSDISDSLSPEEKAIVSALQSGESLKDAIIAQTGLSAAKVSSLLTVMQIKGIISAKPGNIFCLK